MSAFNADEMNEERSGRKYTTEQNKEEYGNNGMYF